ncbi:MAG TPA: hypothetical protein VMZ00_18315 [Sporichthya sp.]|nr:hypothetical protein [Sporichthya sp.]
MRRFWAADRREAVGDSATAPSVRYVYDRPLPYARVLRIDVVGADGAVISSLTKSYHPQRGWVTESVADCA